MIYVDFETFSHVELKTAGVSRYARDDSTDVQCLAYAVDDGPVRLWLPDEPCPQAIIDAASRGHEFHAHNASFEMAIWEHIMVPFYRWPRVDRRKWRCTAAQAAYNGLPRSLEKAAAALGLSEEKDAEGHRIMLRLAKPQWGRLEPTAGQWEEHEQAVERHKKDLLIWKMAWDGYVGEIPVKPPTRPNKPLGEKIKLRQYDREKMAAMYDYCKQDVVVEREIHKSLPPLPRSEQGVWEIDRRINDRGVPVDLALCAGAVKLLGEHAVRVDKAICDLTGGRVERVTQRDRLFAVLQEYDPQLPNLQQATLEEWKFSDKTAEKIAKLRASAGLASVKKMRATLDWADDDGRCRNTTKYYAAGTGRWGGSGPQYQNMKRGPAPGQEVIDVITSGDYEAAASMAEEGDVAGLISTATRSIVCAPPGRTLIQSDYASIEARALAWLAGEEDTLHKFVRGLDLYKDMASHIYGVPYDEITKPQRQIGKIAILGLGYGCGAAKFWQMALKAGADITEEFAENVVEVYRSVNANIVQFWRDAERTAVLATSDRLGRPVAWSARPGTPAIIMQRENKRWLSMKLPSGRKVWYFKPEIAPSKFGNDSFWYTAHKGRMNAYGGLLVENIVQATCRDLLADALKNLEISLAGTNAFTVLTVHDSVMVEADENDEDAFDTVHRIMSSRPQWAECGGGLPVKAETESTRRMN